MTPQGCRNNNTTNGAATTRTALALSLTFAAFTTFPTPTLAQPCNDVELANDSLDGFGNAFVCPCFATGEIPMAIFDVPQNSDEPVTLVNLGIFWQALLPGGPRERTEGALILYDLNQEGEVLPASFTELYRIDNPTLTRGFLNVFDFDALNLELPTKRFGVGLLIANDQTDGNPLFTPSIASDTDGHNDANGYVHNWIYVASANQWQTSQSLGVSGDWIFRATVEVCGDSGDSLTLADPTPGLAGQNNTLTASNATPGNRVTFIYGFTGGAAAVPGCPGTFVDIERPTVAGHATADATGVAAFNAFVPEAARGILVHLQAVEQTTCQTSNRVLFQFQ